MTIRIDCQNSYTRTHVIGRRREVSETLRGRERVGEEEKETRTRTRAYAKSEKV